MPTDPSTGGGPDRLAETPDDELTFAVQDLGRERVSAPAAAPRDLGFVSTRPAAAAPPPPTPASNVVAAPAAPATDGFVIRESLGAVPTAPVDALVVGAPEPAVTAAPDAGADAFPGGFRISSATATKVATPDELWTTRDARPAATAPAPPSRRGWSTRHSEQVDRSAQATMLRLREEAVNVSWKSAWIAVTSCDPRLLRKRASDSRRGR